MVDCYVKIEANRVNYIREHQTELHVAQYNGLFANQQISGWERKLNNRIVSRPPFEFYRKLESDEASVPSCNGHLRNIRLTCILPGIQLQPQVERNHDQHSQPFVGIKFVNEIEKPQVQGFAIARIQAI